MSEERSRYVIERRGTIGEHLKLSKPELNLDEPFSYINKVQARMIEMHDSAIYHAIVEEARKEGINDLYLLDKEFIIDAIREKIRREKF